MLKALAGSVAFALAMSLVIALSPRLAAQTQTSGTDLVNLIYLDVGNKKETYGRVVIKLRPDLAPNHVARFKELAREKFYDGLLFHRVLPNFMAQTGDPKGTGEGGSTKPDLTAEFTPTPHYRGMVSTARTEDPNSANSQFFIMLGDNKKLDGKYTIWGEVISGMQFVDRIKKGDEDEDDGKVADPDRIIRMRVATDVKD